jgi:hypothetical protein
MPQGHVPGAPTPKRWQLSQSDRKTRDCLKSPERLRYMASIVAHRPFELELLRWNHDGASERKFGVDGREQVDNDDVADSERACFRQL